MRPGGRHAAPRWGGPWLAIAVVVALATSGCGSAGPTAAPTAAGSATAASAAPTTGGPSPTAPPATPRSTVQAPTPPPPDLSARPLTWFAPLPPMPGRTGSTDFMLQFLGRAPWNDAAAHVNVYKLYGEWVAYHATDDQLRTAVQMIRTRGMALAVEAGPLDPSETCGQGVESFAGVAEGRRIATRIRAAGGRIDVIALDEPYYFAHVYDGEHACHWSLETIAEGVVAYRDAMRAEFPDVVVGDTEPMPAPVTAAGLAGWLDAYRAAGGEPFAFLHLDMDWSRSGWPALAQRTASLARARDVPIGMIYNGGSATDRAAWIAQAGARVLAFEAAGAPPDHVVFQSWMVQPDKVLPDSDPTTFSGLVLRYFTAHDQLGGGGGGPGRNLAFGAKATASAVLPGSPPSAAVDGDTDTLWSSGSGPTQWIEIDLGGVHRIASIRLTVSQYPAGTTDHRVYGRRADGSLVLLHRFHGATSDGMVLADAPPGGWSGIRAIRIETRASPSWVAWREIEVLAP